MNNLLIELADGDGIVISDGNSDRCYVYYSEIPEMIEKLNRIYNDWNKVRVR